MVDLGFSFEGFRLRLIPDSMEPNLNLRLFVEVTPSTVERFSKVQKEHFGNHWICRLMLAWDTENHCLRGES